MEVNVDLKAMAESVQDWIRRIVGSAGAGGVVVGISGGIDSAVCAALAAGALGPANVLGLLMPCRSLKEDTEDGLKVVDLLGIEHRILDISPVLDAFMDAADLDDVSALNVANVKSRLRMVMLYAHSTGRLVLGTSNYSEILVGYWTKWGDGAADLLPIGRLYKEEVRELAGVLGLPEWLIRRVPSAGLWPGQSDEEEMGVTYRDIMDHFQGIHLPDDIAGRIEKMVRSTEHKRRPIVYFDARKWMEEDVPT